MGSKNQCIHVETAGPRSGNIVDNTGINNGCPNNLLKRTGIRYRCSNWMFAQATPPQVPVPVATPPQVPEPVATPCRSSAVVGTGKMLEGNADIPTDGDASAPAPVAGEIRLSDNAISLRLHRIMKPSAKTGEFRVAENIRKMYTDKKNKTKLVQLFQSCGFDTDRVCFVFGNIILRIFRITRVVAASSL